MFYRLYFHSDGEHIVSAKEVECASDAAVSVMAQIEALKSGMLVEAWDRGRKVARFDPEKKPPVSFASTDNAHV
jgi:hypothetical protein